MRDMLLTFGRIVRGIAGYVARRIDGYVDYRMRQLTFTSIAIDGEPCWGEERSISPSPLPVTFRHDALLHLCFKVAGNPFRKYYIVDMAVRMKFFRPQGYEVLKLHYIGDIE